MNWEPINKYKLDVYLRNPKMNFTQYFVDAQVWLIALVGEIVPGSF